MRNTLARTTSQCVPPLGTSNCTQRNVKRKYAEITKNPCLHICKNTQQNQNKSISEKSPHFCVCTTWEIRLIYRIAKWCGLCVWTKNQQHFMNMMLHVMCTILLLSLLLHCNEKVAFPCEFSARVWNILYTISSCVAPKWRVYVCKWGEREHECTPHML